MKALRAGLALALLLTAPLHAENAFLANQPQNPILGETIDGAVQGTVKPAYRIVEGISDGVYDFLRLRVIGTILPSRLTRSLKAAPKENSAPLFDRTLHDNQARLMERVRQAYPASAAASLEAASALRQQQAWRNWAAEEQISVAVDSLADTLVSRYQLELFGKRSGEYAMKRRNWDPGFLTMAGLLGSTFLYLNGMHASGELGRIRFGLDLRAGLKFQRALQAAGSATNMAALELGLKNLPLTLATGWGISQGRLQNERIGLNYRLRY
jgi:hypothetical protein